MNKVLGVVLRPAIVRLAKATMRSRGTFIRRYGWRSAWINELFPGQPPYIGFVMLHDGMPITRTDYRGWIQQYRLKVGDMVMVRLGEDGRQVLELEKVIS